MNPQLTSEQRKAINEQGGCVEVEDASGRCVLMSIEVFREVMGVGTARNFEESVGALRRSYEQCRQGQTRPLIDALDELGSRHDLSR